MEKFGIGLIGLLLSIGACGCSGDDGDAGTGSTGGSGGSGAGGTGGSSSPDWEILASGDWSLEPGDEGYVCVRASAKRDLYVGAIRPVAPPGTHHTVLTLEDPGAGEDGTFDCTAGSNGPSMIYGSGVGTEPLELPEGIAIVLTEGQQVMLNLHLFNTGKTTLSGTSAVEIKTLDPEDVVHEAQVTLAGKMAGLTIPPGNTTQTGTCTVAEPTTVFAVGPHMHQLGAHLYTTIDRAAGGDPEVLYDQDYSFDEQKHELLPSAIDLATGDKVMTECGYSNPGAQTVKFGESSEAEMCFSVLFEYPARDRDTYYCVN